MLLNNLIKPQQTFLADEVDFKRCGIIEGTFTYSDVVRNPYTISAELCAYKTLMLKSPTIKKEALPPAPTEPEIQIDLSGFPLFAKTSSIAGSCIDLNDCGLFYIRKPYVEPESEEEGFEVLIPRFGYSGSNRLRINRLDYFAEGQDPSEPIEDADTTTTRVLRNSANGDAMIIAQNTKTQLCIVGTPLPAVGGNAGDMFDDCEIGEVNQNKVHSGASDYFYI